MMRCEYCSHECTVADFMTLRHVCEHFYLDSLAQKHSSKGEGPKAVFSSWGKSPAEFGDLVPLRK